jgi:hypothetical protein
MYMGQVVVGRLECTQPSGPEPSSSEVVAATGKLKRYKLPGADQIPAVGETLHSEVHKLIKLIWKKEW